MYRYWTILFRFPMRFLLSAVVGSIALLLSAGQTPSAAPINCETKVMCIDPSDHDDLINSANNVPIARFFRKFSRLLNRDFLDYRTR